MVTQSRGNFPTTNVATRSPVGKPGTLDNIGESRKENKCEAFFLVLSLEKKLKYFLTLCESWAVKLFNPKNNKINLRNQTYIMPLYLKVSTNQSWTLAK